MRHLILAAAAAALALGLSRAMLQNKMKEYGLR